MSFAPLFAAAGVTVVHALLAMAAFGLGVAQLVGPKGVTAHRIMGWGWVAIMAIVALSSFGIHGGIHGGIDGGIHGGRGLGSFSWIHLLSVFTLIVLPLAVLAARRHRHRRHAIVMISLFTGALVIAGGFTFLPGRIMHQVAFSS